jgi:menaquinone-dependent protoporphyrinogen oxidase
MASILVAYATRAGSTGEVAAAIADVLRECGAEVDLQRLPFSGRLGEYDAVVLGAPLYNFRWHKDAVRFLRRNRFILSSLSLAVFALGPFNDEEKEWGEVRGQFDRVLLEFPWLKSAPVKVFGGKFDPSKLTFPFNLMPAMKKLPVTDIRDWDDIRSWGRELAAQFVADEE